MEESYTLCEILVVRLDGSTPTKYAVRLNSEARLSELKRKLSSLCSIPVHRLRLAEVCDSQIRRILSDGAKISSHSSELMAYEICGGSSDCCDASIPGDQQFRYCFYLHFVMYVF